MPKTFRCILKFTVYKVYLKIIYPQTSKHNKGCEEFTTMTEFTRKIMKYKRRQPYWGSFIRIIPLAAPRYRRISILFRPLERLNVEFKCRHGLLSVGSRNRGTANACMGKIIFFITSINTVWVTNICSSIMLSLSDLQGRNKK